MDSEPYREYGWYGPIRRAKLVAGFFDGPVEPEKGELCVNTMLYQQGRIVDRENFGWLLKELKLFNTGVEVGTNRGVFAEQILRWWGGHLTCVDNWAHYGGSADMSPDRMNDRAEAKERLKRFTNRVTFMDCDSVEAASSFEGLSLDFVYIDGDHSVRGFYRDILYWWNKVRPGGLVAGHDIICPNEPDNSNWGLDIQMVLNWLVQYNEGLRIHLIVQTDGSPWSFYIIKPERALEFPLPFSVSTVVERFGGSRLLLERSNLVEPADLR